jgi:hypothetical protein
MTSLADSILDQVAVRLIAHDPDWFISNFMMEDAQACIDGLLEEDEERDAIAAELYSVAPVDVKTIMRCIVRDNLFPLLIAPEDSDSEAEMGENS